MFSRIETPLLGNRYFYDQLSNVVCEKYFSLSTAVQIFVHLSMMRDFGTVPHSVDKEKSTLSQKSDELHGLAPDFKRNEAVF